MSNNTDKEEFFQSLSGFLSVRCKGINLHSSYDPQKEAIKTLSNYLIPGKIPKIVILVGSGLGYLDRYIVENFSTIIVLSFHLCESYLKNSNIEHILSPRYHLWMKKRGVPIFEFLSLHIREMDLEGLEIIPWMPSLRAYPEYQQILDSISYHIKKMKGSLFSLNHFGWKWLNNLLTNYFFWSEQVILPEVETILIAASGPSLNDSIPLMQKYRNKYYLIALPSSIMALQQKDLIPDLITVTDGGYYTHSHFYNLMYRSIPIAMPLIAFPNSSHSCFIFSFSTEFENILLSDRSVWTFPWIGTVAGNALMLSLKMSSQRIILAGQDFSTKDLNLHVKPHSFSVLHEEKSERLSPLIDIYQKSVWNAQENLDIYAHWFRTQSWSPKIYRLIPSHVELPFKTFQSLDFRKLPIITNAKNKIVANPINQELRYQRIQRLIQTLYKQFIKEYTSPSESDLWLYLDTMGFYKYQRAKRLGTRNLNRIHTRLCDKVNTRLNYLKNRWKD